MKTLKNIGRQLIDNDIEEPLLRRIIKEFVDKADMATINDAPELGNLSQIEAAYLAGAAECVAVKLGQPAPDWSESYLTFLTQSYVSSGVSKEVALSCTPSYFRRRLLFAGDFIGGAQK